jgi:uncharacterized RDD family membrane protein YckC
MFRRKKNEPTAANLLVSEDERKLGRQLITPEGIPINFRLAEAGERGAAFMLDSILMFLLLVALDKLLGATIAAGEASGWLSAFVVVLAFFVVNFYFIFFEIRWQGSTPGKRIIGLRVVDRSGGQLSADSVVARNFMRWVEVYIPAVVLAAPYQFWPNATGYAMLAASAWLLVLGLLPFFNSDRLRVGDFIGGTIVVQKPRTVLMPDLGESKARPVYIEAAREVPSAGWTFSEEQLSHYGVYELQVLEELLRKKDDSIEHLNKEHMVFDRIVAKIGWRRPKGKPVDIHQFLSDFYAAQRAHLEQQMLFGKKREDKFAK